MPVQNFTLPKPRNDDDWELWCKKIFASVHNVPDFQRFKTRGSNQLGIDLVTKLDSGKVVVVQCKRRSTEKELTKTEAEADYQAALKLDPAPDHFIIATSHDKKGLQEWALGKSGPTARVYAWPDIEDLLAVDDALRAALYGTADLEAIGKSVENAISGVRADAAGAREEIAALRRALVDQPVSEAERFSEEYQRRVTDALDELDLFGVDLPKEARKYKLSVAYISMNLESGAGEQESGPQAATTVLGGEFGRRLLIRGDAGGGKSTLLKWAAVQCRGYSWEKQGDTFHAKCSTAAANSLHNSKLRSSWIVAMSEHFTGIATRSLAAPNTVIAHLIARAQCDALPWCLRVPFLIRLRDCAAGKLPPIPEFARRTANLLGSTPKGWEESVLRGGQGLVLLDGIDEVPPRYRALLHKHIKGLILQFPENMYVLTTRPLSEGEPEWLDELGFQQARVAPMSRLDREACIDRWHDAVAEELVRSKRPDARLAELPAKLKAALHDAPEIARLATNPLLCAMICALHRSKNHLPENLNELLEALCTILLYSREKETPEFDLKEFDPIYADLSYEDRKAIVSHLAKYMVMEGESALPRAMVKKKIGEALQPLKDRSSTDAEVVLKGLLERSGMLREKTASTIDFVHNTFKEYLAAIRFLDRNEVKTLAKQAHEAGWDNVAVFAAAAAVRNQEFSDRLVAEILPPPAGKAAPATKRRKVYKDAKAVDADEAKRYKRAVTAVRVVSAIRTKLKPETQKRYDAMKKVLFPPRSLSDAAGLATAGNAVLKFVSFAPKLTDSQRVRCIRTLRLIGTSEATERLLAFRGERTIEVVEELAQAIDPFEIGAVVEAFTETVESMKTRGVRRLEHEAWRREVRRSVRTQIRTMGALRGRGDVVRLELSDTAVEDSAIAALASAETGLNGLAALYLANTEITDVGLAALAAKDTGLKALTTLVLGHTSITDAGLAALAAKGTGLKALNTLSLNGVHVTDKGLAAIAARDTGLKALSTLILSGTPITDAGLVALAAKDTGLKALTTLSLTETRVSDTGLAALTAKDTGLKALTLLNLGSTQVTDAGASALAAKDTGLKTLTTLNLGGTQITDVGLIALAANDTGLKALAAMHLNDTGITDAGLSAIAAPGAGLEALAVLWLHRTSTSDAAKAAVKKRFPYISIYS